MAVSVTFNGTTYTVPSIAGEDSWETTLSTYLQALASGAAVTSVVKQTSRVATTTPVTVSATTDFTVVTKLSSPGSVAVNLPAGVTKQMFAIVDGTGDAATNNVTITASGAELINGSSTFVINKNFGGVIIHWNGTGWNIIGTINMLTAGSIVNADINASAAIAATKIADGSVDNTEFQYLNGVTSAIQTQLDTKALAADLTNHVNDVTDAHDASAISSVPSGNLAASDVQTALNELQTDVDGRLSLSGGTMTGNIAMGTNKVTGLGTPSADNDAATKAYVDNAITGLKAKQSVKAATTVAGTLASDFENGDSIDGVTLSTNDRILIKNQSAPAENGIYIVQASGAPSRSLDANTWDELVSAYCIVEEGTVNKDIGYLCSADAGGTLGVTSLPFVQFTNPGAITTDGQGVEISANQITLELDGSTLSKSATGVKVADAGITETQLNASVAGDGIAGGAGTALSVDHDGQGLQISGGQLALELDGSTLSKSATGVKVADGGVTNTQINASAAIAMSKLAALTSSRVLGSDGSGVISALDTTTYPSLTELAYVKGVTSAIQTQINSKQGLLTVVTPGSYPHTAVNNTTVLVDTSAARSIQLPSPAADIRITIKDAIGSANTNNITVLRAGSEKIEGVTASRVLSASWGAWTFVSNGTDWFLI